jgi:hypothetical protein
MIVNSNSVSFSSLIIDYDLYAKWFTIAIFILFLKNFASKQTWATSN